MKNSELASSLKEIIQLPVNERQVFSIYVNLENNRKEIKHQLNIKFNLLKTTNEKSGKDIEIVHKEVLRLIRQSKNNSGKGIAIFIRCGEDRFFKHFTFDVPLPDLVFIDRVPHIFPLIELKDICDRYVVLISTEKSARILEVALGSITREEWLKRPPLRERVGREWTHLHYQNHRRDRSEKFHQEKITIIENLMLTRGNCHLILAGSPKCVNRIKGKLPAHLKKFLIDTAKVDLEDSHESVVRKTIGLFAQKEEEESQSMIEHLKSSIDRGEDIALGSKACFKAVSCGLVDVLFISRHRSTEQNLFVKERVIQEAIKMGCRIETVSSDRLLDSNEGLGALFRYPCKPYYYLEANKDEVATTSASEKIKKYA